MLRMRIMAVATVAIFAVSAFVASSAFALPEVGRCVARAGGRYTDSNCTLKSVRGNGTHEFLKGAEKLGFTTNGGFVVFEGASNVECSEEHGSGKYDADGTTGAIKGVEDVVLAFKRCSIPGFAGECVTPGFGEIVTTKLKGNLGYISGEKTRMPVVGLELTPEVKNAAYTEINCFGGAAIFVVKAATTNCLIAPVTPPNVSSFTLEQKYKSSGSVQEPNHFQRTPTHVCQLEETVNGGSPELVGEKLTSTITNEEPLELKA